MFDNWDPATLWDLQPLLLTGIFLLISGAALLWLLRALTRFNAKVEAGEGPWRDGVIRWMPLVKLLLIIFEALLVVRIAAEDGAEIVVDAAFFAFVIAVGLSGIEISRDLFAGVIITLQRSIKIGDFIEIDTAKGQVLQQGLRSTRLKLANGSVQEFPNRKLISRTFTNVNAEQKTYPVEVKLQIPQSCPIPIARSIALRAALISRFTSPYFTPIVLLEDTLNIVSLTIHVHVFAPSLEGLLRNDLIEIFHEGIEPYCNEKTGLT